MFVREITSKELKSLKEEAKKQNTNLSGKKQFQMVCMRKSLKHVLERVERVKTFRLQSGRPETKKLADTPTLFGEIRQPTSDYLIIPKVSSETRQYIPIGYCPPEYIANGSSLVVADANKYEFGIITSEMHMAWMRYVGGRTKSDYQYSNSLIYNNFPWPEVTDKQEQAIADKAQAVLDARTNHPDSTLAEMYNPTLMPVDLRKAHNELDKAVDKAYRPKAFANELERIQFLFERYQQLTAPLTTEMEKKPKRKRKSV